MAAFFRRFWRRQRNASQGREPALFTFPGRRRWWGVVVFITLPALALGTAAIAGAYGMSRLAGPSIPTCDARVVPAPARGSFPVGIFNASGIDGAAAGVGKQLTVRGFKITSIENQPGLASTGPAQIAYGKKGLDNAILLSQQIQGAELLNDGRAGTDVAVILGEGFVGLVAAPPPIPPKPSQITVNVFNTTFRSGLATTVAKGLDSRSFRTAKVGNDPSNAFLPNDAAVLRYGEKGEEGAAVLAQHVPGAKLTRVARDTATIDLVLGNKYAALTPAAEVPPPPPAPPKPPTTLTRPCGVF